MCLVRRRPQKRFLNGYEPFVGEAYTMSCYLSNTLLEVGFFRPRRGSQPRVAKVDWSVIISGKIWFRFIALLLVSAARSTALLALYCSSQGNVFLSWIDTHAYIDKLNDKVQSNVHKETTNNPSRILILRFSYFSS